jgi:type I restriction enzyme R subunit
VKRLLKKYKYPPEESENAMEIVLKQCEEWSDNAFELNDSVNKGNKHYVIPDENEYLQMVAEPMVKYGKDKW